MNQPAFKPGTRVFDPSNPGVIGTISARPPKLTPAGWKYRVQLQDGSHKQQLEPTLLAYLDESSDDPAVLLKRGLLGRTADLRRNLTYRILAGNLANVIYSLGVTNTKFYPHQFKPLLTLLDSPVKGILIADEVGLGKTIEAGLIWTELRARENFSKLLVVCPAALREKWKDELILRFGIDAQIVSAAELVSAIKSPAFHNHSDIALIASYDAISAPSNNQNTNGQKYKTEFRDLISQYEFETLFDCVIFDEAHVMRNESSARWKGGQALTSACDYQIMLSATPINLKNQDLYNLLHLLDPDNFAYQQDFNETLVDNAQIIQARDKVMDTRTSVGDVLSLIQVAKQTKRFQYSGRLKSIEEDLSENTEQLSKQKRVSIAEALEKISLLSHVVTRTRKKDVLEKKVTRKVTKVPVTMSNHERKLYEMVTSAIQEYGSQRDINHGFLLTQPQRMVTSCPSVFSPYLDNEFEEEESSKPVKSFIAKRLKGAFDSAALRSEDTKFAQLQIIIDGLDFEDTTDKLIIFSTFRNSVDYIAARLANDGVEAMAVKGGDPTKKSDLIDAFRSSKTCRVLVCTEVLAEGVDLQFCNKMVNYDLPWNPTRIEQRIGRIDRLGQERDVIHIFNLFYEDTVDSRVIYRLYDRIGVFEEALGESEIVLGEEISKLENYLFSDKRTLEEEKEQIESSELALEQIKLSREQLQNDSQYLITHGQALLDRIEASSHLSRAISEEDLIDYVHSFIENQTGGHTFKYINRGRHRYEIRLPADMCVEFKDFCNSRELLSRNRLISGHSVECEFNKEITNRNSRTTEYINQFHPLISFINQSIESQSGSVHPLVAVRLKFSTEYEIPVGKYLFCINSWYTPGAKKEEYFAYRAFYVDSGKRLQPDNEELLVQWCRLNGEDWIDASSTIKHEKYLEILERAEDELNHDFLKEKVYKNQENSDRLREQRHAYMKFYERRSISLKNQLSNIHENDIRLQKMTEGKLKKLNERYELRMAEIDRLEQAEMRTTGVCVGLVDVY